MVKIVMVVDDEDDIREMIALLMKKQGFETQTAENGEEFLNKIDVIKPDLVTLDVMMPGLTTVEILKELKKKKTESKIILVTILKLSADEKDRIFKMGNVIDYIKKPFNVDEFIETIKRCINN